MNDKEIVELIYSKNDAGLSALAKKYGKKLLHICEKIAGKTDGEECLNDAYLAVWNSIPPERPENLFGYAAVTARRKALSRYRQNKAQKRSQSQTLPLSELGDCLPSKETAERLLNERELTNLINRFLGELKPRERKMFLLRYFGGEEIKSIANKLLMTPVAVKTSLSRQRARLREYLEKEDVFI